MSNDLQNTPAPADGQPVARHSASPQPHVVPPVDVYEDDHGITLLADLPGVPREGLNVRVDGDSLQIEGTAGTGGADNLELVWGEARVPVYRRRFTLSRELDTSRIDAQLKDGVLRLSIPKAEEARPRRIEVRAL
jgi:HSP20 family molecular chaperone IbpA